MKKTQLLKKTSVPKRRKQLKNTLYLKEKTFGKDQRENTFLKGK